MGLGVKTHQRLLPGSISVSCVTFLKFSNLSASPFPHLGTVPHLPLHLRFAFCSLGYLLSRGGVDDADKWAESQ